MKKILLVLMKALVYQHERLVLILVDRTQKFAWVNIIILIIVTFLLMENKYLSIKLTVKMLTFQINFFSKVFLMDLVLLSLEKYF